MRKGLWAAVLMMLVAATCGLSRPVEAMPLAAPSALKNASGEVNLTEKVWCGGYDGCGYRPYYRPYGYRPYYRPYYGYRPYYRPYGYGYGYRPYYRPYGYGYGYRPYYRPYFSGYHGYGYGYRPVPWWVSGPYY